MAPKRDHARAPPSTFLGPSAMTEGMVKDLETRGVINPDTARAPPSLDVRARPEDDEVIVFKDFFLRRSSFPPRSCRGCYLRTVLGLSSPDDLGLLHQAQPLHVVGEDMPGAPDGGELCPCEPHSLPAEDYHASRL